VASRRGDDPHAARTAAVVVALTKALPALAGASWDPSTLTITVTTWKQAVQVAALLHENGVTLRYHEVVEGGAHYTNAGSEPAVTLIYVPAVGETLRWRVTYRTRPEGLRVYLLSEPLYASASAAARAELPSRAVAGTGAVTLALPY